MDHFSIEQALFGQTLEFPAHGSEGITSLVPLGRSPGFQEEWLPFAEDLIHDYGERPAGVRCPLAVFAQPFAAGQVAVVQVADQSANMLAFHFLVMAKDNYQRFLGDPFHLAEKLPANWQRRGLMPSHSWPCVPLPSRTIEQVRQVLQRLKTGALSEDWEPPSLEQGMLTSSVGAHARLDLPTSASSEAMAKVTSPPEEVERTVENSESPALLGGVQALVDGGRLFFRRPGPDMNLLKGLWTLLPTSTRCRLWPASFAFGNHLQFDAVVLPRPEPSELEGYNSEEQAIDYPEGRYELSLQTAAETGDQQQLDQLLRRRSVWETWRLGLCLLALMMGLMLVSKFIPVQAPPSTSSATRLRAVAAASVVGAGADPWTALAILLAGKTVETSQAGE